MNNEDLEAAKQYVEKLRPKVKTQMVNHVRKAMDDGDAEVTKQALFANVDTKALMLLMGVPAPEGHGGKRHSAKRIKAAADPNSRHRSRIYDVDAYQIGSFKARQTHESHPWKNRIKINITQHVIQFWFIHEVRQTSGNPRGQEQYADPQLNGLQYVSDRKLRIFTVNVPFANITAMCFDQKNIHLRFTQPISMFSQPWCDITQNVLAVDELKSSFDPTNGEFLRSTNHSVTLIRNFSVVWKRTLIATDPRFSLVIQDKKVFMNEAPPRSESFYCYAPLGNEANANPAVVAAAQHLNFNMGLNTMQYVDPALNQMQYVDQGYVILQNPPVQQHMHQNQFVTASNAAMMYVDPQLNQLRYADPKMDNFNRRNAMHAQDGSDFFAASLQSQSGQLDIGVNLQYADPLLNELKYVDPGLDVCASVDAEMDFGDYSVVHHDFQSSESFYTNLGDANNGGDFMRPSHEFDENLDAMTIDDNMFYS